MTALALLAALIGFAALALAMERHQRLVVGRLLPPRSRRRLRRLGWAAIALAYGAAAQAWGGAIGVLVWAGLLSLAAAAVLLSLSWQAHRR